MPFFYYEAKDEKEQMIRDTIEAPDLKEAVKILQGQKLTIINITEQSAPGSPPGVFGFLSKLFSEKG